MTWVSCDESSICIDDLYQSMPMDHSPIDTIQYALDLILPSVTSLDTQFDVEALFNHDTNLNCAIVGRVDTSKASEPIKNYYRFVPRIRSGMAPKRQTHLLTALHAVYKRNLCDAHFAYAADYGKRSLDCIEKAMDVLCVENYQELLKDFKVNPIKINERNCEAWAAAQTPEKLKRLAANCDGRLLQDLDLNTYMLFLKPFNKPPNDTSVVNEVQQPQTVVYSDVSLNAYFGPVFRELEDRWLSMLRPNVLVNKKKNAEQIERFINDSVRDYDDSNHLYIENDFSAYDKSQHIETWHIELEFYKLLGLDYDLLKLWMDAHWFTKINAPGIGLMMYILFQRKSGDVTTSFGNTIVNMLTTASVLNTREMSFALYLGDDSLIRIRRDLVDYDRLKIAPRMLLDMFNLPSKVLLYKTGYFCGYYILPLGQKWCLLSDALRRSVKLGRADIRSEDMFEEHWTSFRDVTRNYDNALLVDVVVDSIAERYSDDAVKIAPTLYQALNSLRKSYSTFRKLWTNEISRTNY
jgi:hypothetical protein